MASIWSLPNVIIAETGPTAANAATLSMPQALALRHDYEAVGGVKTFRLGSGSLKRRGYWTRLRVTISGDGMVPAALGNLDWTLPMDLSCGAPRSSYVTTNTWAVPATSRSDAPVYAVAWLNGYPIPTNVVVVSGTATADTVSGADAYEFFYYPRITAFITKTESEDRASGRSTWNIVAEEI